MYMLQAIESRLQEQTTDSENARLRHLLNEKGGSKASVDIVEQRLAELKGVDVSSDTKSRKGNK